MKSRRLLVAALAIPLVGYGACRALRGSPSPLVDQSLLFDRAWLEREPEQATDYVHAMWVAKRPAQGVFFRGSSYDMRIERIDYDRSEAKLDLRFPQTGKKASVRFKITECKEKDAFDLCLDLSENPWGGPKRYYGLSSQDDARPAVRKIAARAAAEAEAR
jgi:hypothetical protein